LLLIIWLSSSASSLSKNKPSKKIDEEHIAVVEIKGAIGQECDYKTTLELVKKAFEHKNSIGVILDIDSPGGSAYDTEIIANGIEKLKQKYPDKKIISYGRNFVASGSYWLATLGQKIYASEMSVVGSIGVRQEMLNFYDFLIEHKIKPISIHAGEHKVAGSPIAPFSSEDTKNFQDICNKTHEIFKNAVKKGRGDRLKINQDTFSGLIWLGNDAKEIGLIDDLKDFDDVITLEFGDYPVKYVRKPQDLNWKQFINDTVKEISNASLQSLSHNGGNYRVIA
ncbi:S49 family peptidase, partial [bacterium]|nr:S49 family peptidase [bacterium]